MGQGAARVNFVDLIQKSACWCRKKTGSFQSTQSVCKCVANKVYLFGFWVIFCLVGWLVLIL